MRRARFALAVLFALVLPLQGCSLFRNSNHAEGVDVVVDNNLSIPTPLTIYVVSDIGARQLVGTVSPGRRAALHFRAATITGNYRLVARVSSQTRGDYLTSNSVALTGGETVTWEIRNNTVLVSR